MEARGRAPSVSASDRAGSAATELPPCVGRERELAALAGLFRDVIADGHGRVALVTGPGGIGKTRLLLELKRRLSACGAVVVEGRARAGAAAYQPLLEAVDATARALADR